MNSIILNLSSPYKMGQLETSYQGSMPPAAFYPQPDTLPKLTEKEMACLKAYLPENYLNNKKLCLLKSWHGLQGCRSIYLFYSLQDYKFLVILRTESAIEVVPTTRKGFDYIKVPLSWARMTQSRPDNHQTLMNWISFLNKELRSPIIKKIDDEFMVELRIGGLMGGGAKVSKTSPSRGSIQSPNGVGSPTRDHSEGGLRSAGTSIYINHLNQFIHQDTQITSRSQEVKTFLLKRYELDNAAKSDKDTKFVDELTSKIAKALLPVQSIAIVNHLNEMIDVYETEFFDQTVFIISESGSSKGKPALEDYISGFTSKELCLNLLRKGYFSKEQTKGGIGKIISEKILKSLSNHIALFKQFEKEDKEESEESTEDSIEEFSNLLLRIAKKEELEELLASLSEEDVEKVLSFIKEKLSLESESKISIMQGFVGSSELTLKDIKNECLTNSVKPEEKEEGTDKNQEGKEDDEDKEDSVIGRQLQSYMAELRKEVLMQMNLLDHEPSTLVELFNLLQQDQEKTAKDTSPEMSSPKVMLDGIKNLMMFIIQSYKENESSLKKHELEFLLPLAFAKDVEIFKLFLEVFLFDFQNDILFDHRKVNMMSFILIGAMKNKNFNQYCSTDDLLTCLKILKPKIEDLSVTAGNINLQEAMTSLNNILFLMGFIGAKGVKGEDMEKINELTKYMETHALEKAFNLVKKKSIDPSLEMKKQYSIEAMKRIEGTSWEEWQGICEKIFQVAEIAVGLGVGIWEAELSSIGAALLQLKDLAWEYYQGRAKSWYDEVNMLRFLSEEPIEVILEELFGKTGSKRNDRYTFFAVEFLLASASQQHRKLKEKKIAAQAVWFLANGYDYKKCRSENALVKSARFKKNRDIVHYVSENLTKIAETASLDFGIFIQKIILHAAPKLEFEEHFQLELASPSNVLENSLQEESLGKKFYLKTLMEKTPMLYALAKIQKRSEKTLIKPEVIIHLRAIKKDKENNELFKEIIRTITSIKSTTVLNDAKKKFEELLDNGASKEDLNKALEEVAKMMVSSEQTIEDQTALDFLRNGAVTSLNEKITEFKDKNTEDLFKAIENFVDRLSFEKVLLIQGDAGSGKTLLLQLVEERLWKKYNVLLDGNTEHKNRLPLRIVLSEVRSYDRAVEEFLLQNGCTREAFEEIKREPVVIMFDGYDEIAQNINLYNLNKLDEWDDVKVIFTSRKDNLSSLKEDYVLCFSPGKDKEKVLSYIILPINESQIKKYFETQKQKNLSKIKAYENEIMKILHFDNKNPRLPLTWACEKQIKELDVFLKSDRIKALINFREKLKTMLPEITELENDIKNVRADEADYTPITQAVNNQIANLEKLPDPSEQESIISKGTQSLEKISELEESKKLDSDILACLNELPKLETSIRIDTVIKKIDVTLKEAEDIHEKLRVWKKEHESEFENSEENDTGSFLKMIGAYLWDEMKGLVTMIDDCIKKLSKYETENFGDDDASVKEITEASYYKGLKRLFCVIFDLQVKETKSFGKNLIKELDLQVEQEQRTPEEMEAQEALEREDNLRFLEDIKDMDKWQEYSDTCMDEMGKRQSPVMTKFMIDLVKTLALFFNDFNSQRETLTAQITRYARYHLVENGKIEQFKEDIEQTNSYAQEIKNYSIDFKEKFLVVQAFQDQLAKLNNSSSHPDSQLIIKKLEAKMRQITVLERAIKSADIRKLLKVQAIDKQIVELKKFTDLESIISKFKEIATSPFMLKMLLETLVKFPESSANKAKLYKLFVDIHFERERDKLIRTEKVPSQFNIIDSFYQYSKDLAINMFTRKVTSIQAKSKGYKMLGIAEIPKPNVWNRFFDDTDVMTRLAKRGAQILEDEGFVRFVHKSLMEYFAALVLVEEILDFNRDSHQDHDFCLDKTSLIDNETVVYAFIREIAEDDDNENENEQKELNIFDKKLLEMFNTPSFMKKCIDELEKGTLLANLFLILLLRKNFINKISQMKDDSAALNMIMNIFKWIFSESKVSKKFLEILKKAKGCESNLYRQLRPLLAIYYHIMTKKGSKTEIGSQMNRIVVENVKFKISLPSKKIKNGDPEQDNKTESEDNQDETTSGKKIFELKYMLQGKFFIHGSQDNIVVIKATHNGQHLLVNDDSKDEQDIASKLTLGDIDTPWDIRESKWILKMDALSSFTLYSVRNTSITLTGTFLDAQAYKAFFGTCCSTDLKTGLFLDKEKFYSCKDCGKKDEIFCESCKENCHKDHKIEDYKNALPGGYCDCRFNGCCKITKGCSAKSDNFDRSHKMFKCTQCPSDLSISLCLYCKQHHEKEISHTVFDSFVGENEDAKTCQCDCMSSRTKIMAQAWLEDQNKEDMILEFVKQ